VQRALALQLNEGDVLTECRIKTMSDGDDDSLDFSGAFRSAEHVNKLILHSDRLRDAFLELSDLPGASNIKILVSPSAPYFRLSACGQFGVCEVDFAQGADSFSHFECPVQLCYEYRLTLLHQAAKPLADAEKTFLRMNSEGMLSIQHLIRQADGQKTYVDFFLLAADFAHDDAGLQQQE
jgi:cell cycle checkpoint protein